jgi:hypothetical protein
MKMLRKGANRCKSFQVILPGSREWVVDVVRRPPVKKLLVAYAEPGGSVEKLCRTVLSWGKPLLTLASAANAHLVAMGARAVRLEDLTSRRSKGP